MSNTENMRLLPIILAVIIGSYGATSGAQRPRITDPKVLAELRELFVPEAYLRTEDQDRARRLRDGFDGPTPCEIRFVELGTPVIGSLPTDQCYKMTAPQRWKGIWRNAFEGSRFCPGAKDECDDKTSPDVIWLEIKEGQPLSNKQGAGGVYSLEFVGRRTLYRGMQGHMGMSNYEIIVDRMISIKELVPPPPLPTAEQQEAWIKECEAKPNCFTLRESLEMLTRKK